MKTYSRTLGGVPAFVYVPDLNDPAVDGFRLFFPSGALYGLDVESTALDGAGVFAPDFEIRTVQFGTEGYAWVLRMDDPAQRAAAIELLSDPTVEFTSHTRIDVMAVARRLGVDIAGRNLDTHMLAVLTDPDPEQKGDHDLKNQVGKNIGKELKDAETELHSEFERLYREKNTMIVDHLNQPMISEKTGKPRKLTKAAIAKETLVSWGFNHVPTDNPVYTTYAGMDAISVRRLAPVLVAKTHGPATNLRTERYLAEQAIRMQQRGMRVDTDRLHELIVRTKEEMATPAAQLLELTGLRPEQPAIIPWMTEHGVEWADEHPRTPTGGISLAKEAKTLLLGYEMPAETRPAVEAYVEYMRRLDRYRTTEKIATHLDDKGYLHAQITPLSCRTGRMASSEPNVQNISKKDRELRGLFLPPKGEILVECDFSQVEPRTAAALTKEQVLIDLIMAGENIYKITMDELGVTKAQAKLMQLSILYGVGGTKLAASIGVSQGEAYDLIRNYWATYSSAKAYWDQMTSLTEVDLISGARVPSGHWKDGSPKSRANLNTLCQGNAAILFKGALVEFSLHRGRAQHNWLWLHDANIITAPEDDPTPVIKDLEESMNFDFLSVPISASADLLIDEDGVSRWMAGEDAQAIAAAKATPKAA